MKETRLQHELVRLRARLLVMCASSGMALEETCLALKDGDIKRAQAVVDGDAGIDELENEIDGMALMLLARNQPVAQDLRFIVASLRMIGDLERIGDEAASIAEKVLVLGGALPKPMQEAIEPLASAASKLYADAIDALRNEDERKALALSRQEDESQQNEVQALHRIMDLFRSEAGQDNGSVYLAGMHGILICHSLNRICRRAANIAEQTYFILNGANLRHTGGQ